MIDRERFGSGSLPVWVRNEHRARWRFASNFVSGKTVADCACGAGEGSALFAQSGAAVVHAFDLSQGAVKLASERCAGLPSVVVRQASGLSLPLASRSIDVYVSMETIEHVDADGEFLREARRVLAPSGLFLCSTPNRIITMPGKTMGDRPWNPFHVREYSEPEFRELLRDYFRDIVVYGQNALPDLRVHALAWLGRQLPGHLGGRIHSALKLPRFLYDREEHHQVAEIPQRRTCEYLVAVCARPKS